MRWLDGYKGAGAWECATEKIHTYVCLSGATRALAPTYTRAAVRINLPTWFLPTWFPFSRV